MKNLKTAGIMLLCSIQVMVTGCAMTDDQPEIDESHYRVLTGEGEPASLSDIIAAGKEADVMFLGESHNDPVAHYLEMLILKQAWDENLVLSLEMFESDVQYVLDEYLKDQIREDHMVISARAWEHYETDYRDMIEFIKQKQGRVVAANAPRRYVNMVTRMGQESLLELSPEAKQYLPPLPYAGASKAYAEKFMNLMGGSPEFTSSPVDEDLSEKDAAVRAQQEEEQAERVARGLQSQSLWDASMAWSVASQLERDPQSRVLHVNGSFHTESRMGIPDHLSRYRPDAEMLVVTMVSENEFPEFSVGEITGLGDFVIITDGSLPRR